MALSLALHSLTLAHWKGYNGRGVHRPHLETGRPAALGTGCGAAGGAAGVAVAVAAAETIGQGGPGGGAGGGAQLDLLAVLRKAVFKN